jgi:hypothetical protein
MIDSGSAHQEQVPRLPLEAWQDTHDSLHMWMQIGYLLTIQL